MAYPDFVRDNLSFLLVGNNATTASILHLLKSSWFSDAQVTVAVSLEDATVRCASSPADLILLDLETLGAQARERIQQTSQMLAALPTLILCNESEEELAQELIQIGIQGLLSKEALNPILFSQILYQALKQIKYQSRSEQRINELFDTTRRLECALDNTLVSVEQLHQYAAVLESILNAIPDAVVFADPERRVCRVNSVFSDVFCCHPIDVLGRTIQHLYETPANYHHQAEQHHQPKADSSIRVHEERYRRQTGEIFIGETIGTVVKSRAGKPLGHLDIIRDLSDRKQAEQTIQRSEMLNRALLGAIPDRIVWMKLDGTYLNVEGQTLAGTHHFLDNTICDYLPEAHAQQKLQHAQRVLQTGEPAEYERLMTCQGQTRYEEVRIVPCDSESVLVLVRDITARKRSALALAASEARYRALYLKTPVMLHSIDHQGRLISVSDYWLQKLGYAREEVIGRKSAEFLTTASQQYAQQVVLPKYFETGSCTDIPYQIVTQTGEVLDVLLSATAERDAANNVVRSLAVMVDVTERNQAVAALQASEARFQTFMDNSPALAFIKDADSGEFLYVNRPFEQFFQIAATEIVGKTDLDWLPPAAAAQNMQNDQTVMQLGQPLQLQESVPDAAGNDQDWLVSKFPYQDLDNQRFLGGVALNITAQKRLEQDLYNEKELAQVTLDSIGDAVISTDARGCVNYLNPIAEAHTGWSQAEAQGRPLTDVFIILNEYTRSPVDNPVDQVLAEGIIVGLANHTILIAKDGSERSIEDSAAPIRNSAGEIIGTVLVFHDVTEARRLSKQLTWQATHDELTGLFNRRGFEAQLAELLVTVDSPSVLCYLDLDQFKLVNDTCGHAAGDLLLQQVTDSLNNQVRITDVVARLGGDEFAILLRQCSLEFARRIANLMCQSIREQRFVWGEHSFAVGVSIGIVEITPETRSLTTVLAAADAACYAAKEAGRNRIHVYRTDDLVLSRQRDEQQWCLRIDQALEAHRFQLYHQPIAQVDKIDGARTHTELLVRMLGEQGKIIPPMAFIPAAERYHRMSKIDEWVILHFLAELSTRESPLDMLYNINLSGASLSDEEFLTFLRAQLTQKSVDATKICFEITETAAISNLQRVTTFMKSLKQLGCQFALDDFGSGMSSFRYLKQLPVDYIKIDGDFVQKLNEPVNQAIVQSICSIGQAMDVQIVAERVENLTTAAQLKALGVDYVQGYGIARPSPFVSI